MTLKAKLVTCFVAVFFLMALVGLHGFYELNHAQSTLRTSAKSAHALQAAVSDIYRIVFSTEMRLDRNITQASIKQLKSYTPLSVEGTAMVGQLARDLETLDGRSSLSNAETEQMLSRLNHFIFIEERAHSERITELFLENAKRKQSWVRTAMISFFVAIFVTMIMCSSIVIEVDTLAALAKKVLTNGLGARVKLATAKTKKPNDELGFVANVLEDLVEERKGLVETSPNPKMMVAK